MDTLRWLTRLTRDGRKLRGREIQALRRRLGTWSCLLAWQLSLSPNELRRIEADFRPLPEPMEYAFRRWAVAHLTSDSLFQGDWLNQLDSLTLHPVWVARPTEEQAEAQHWVEHAQA